MAPQQCRAEWPAAYPAARLAVVRRQGPQAPLPPPALPAAILLLLAALVLVLRCRWALPRPAAPQARRRLLLQASRQAWAERR